LTGYGRVSDVQHAMSAGFSAHLTKPVTLDRLVATLAEVLGPGAATGQAGAS
jgi:two-component system CheB/CheR fusion protein